MSGLTALKVKRETKPGMHGDGNGLYLQITPSKSGGVSKSWLYRYKVGGKSRKLGLGSLHAVSLADARQKAVDARRLLLGGNDPVETKRKAKTVARLNAAKEMTFDQCAAAYIAAHRSGWKNAKHSAQWTATIKAYVTPVFGSLPVAAVDVGLIMRVLEPIWTTKPETASRLRGRIKSILDYAKARGYRDGENTARWKGHLDQLLAPRSKVRKVKHHPALPYDQVSAFMIALREQSGIAARALEFLIFTVTRTSETLNATWNEIDLTNRMWTIPAERMKAGREHRVPLSGAAVAVLKTMQTGRQSDYIFPGRKRRKPLSNMAMLVLLRRMGRGDLTGHGFRSSFRDWCAEQTNFPSEVAEMALAHAVGSKVEAAYRRGDLLEKRLHLMDEWSRYCSSSPDDRGKVIPLRRGE